MSKGDSIFRVSSELYLLNELFNYKLNTQEFLSSEKVVTDISELIDSFKTIETGWALASITNLDETKLFLIMKKDAYYVVRHWIKKESIQKKLSITIHDRNNHEDLIDFMAKTRDNNYRYDEELVSDLMLIPSLNGYSINKKKVEDFINFMKKDDKFQTRNIDSVSAEFKEYIELIKTEENNARTELRKQLNNFVEKLQCPELVMDIKQKGIEPNQILIAEIEEVRMVGNKRYYKIAYHKVDELNPSKVNVGYVVGEKDPEEKNGWSVNPLGDIYYVESRSTYNSDCVEDLKRLPYNFIDKGRKLIGIKRTNSYWNIIIGPDNRVEKNANEIIKTTLKKYINAVINKGLYIDDTIIKTKDQNFKYNEYLNLIEGKADLSPIALMMKTLKKMVDEFHYVVKKQKSIGKDINITDKIKLNHEEGKVSYNNFSIKINDELVKQKLFNAFQEHLLKYYRGETSEETILNNILDNVFYAISERINYYSKESLKLDITINDVIDICVEEKVTTNKSKLMYINGQRFNKNEVLIILREITCYRSKEEAEMFIKTIGKIGLSTYIGISTGYELKYEENKRLFKFKKEKGRSKYCLLLDNLEIPINGKKLISMLYNNFLVADYRVNTKVNDIIFSSVAGTADYLKYRFLIDSSYESFKERSKAFLDKKVQDVEGKYVKYLNNKSNKWMDAVFVTGSSGSNYVISYDTKGSYVFINPEEDTTGPDHYKEGKYICMIDQSNIKSNIGYDTVISKLMALKHDSIIAEQIYNLKEEIGDVSGESDEQNN